MSLGRKHRSSVLLLAATIGLSACKGATPGAPPPTAAATTAAAGQAGAGQTRPVPGLDDAALEIMNQPAYEGGQWAILVRDIESGETLVSLLPSTLLEPGSVTKTYSMGAGWIEFGPDHKLVTPVKRRGEVVDGVLNGDLVLVGKGDMTMGGRTKPDGTVDFTDLDHNDANALPGATLTTEDPLAGLDKLAAQVKAAGITRIGGDVIVDDRLWNPHALENGPISPIIINNNLIDFTTSPTQVGQPASVAMRPRVAPWTLTNEVQTVAVGQPTRIDVSSPEDGEVLLTGTIAADSQPAVNVHAFPDPATFARTAFIEALGRAGVAVVADPIATNPAAALPSEAEVDALPVVAELESLPLEEDTTYTLKVSYNRGAETMVCLLAVAAGSKDCADGLARADDIWEQAGLDTDEISLIDGSGLAQNLISAKSQVELATIMAKRPDAARWRETLPILGVDGSLAMVEEDGPAKGKVLAKTGTLGGFDLFNERFRLATKALGGYIDSAKGRRLAFAIIATNAFFPDIDSVFAANDDLGEIARIIQQSY